MEKTSNHVNTIGTQKEWLEARLKPLKEEKELRRRNDELTRERQALPWVRTEKDYRFETEEGEHIVNLLMAYRWQITRNFLYFRSNL